MKIEEFKAELILNFIKTNGGALPSKDVLDEFQKLVNYVFGG